MRPFAWLAIEITLRGTTRAGTLYVTLTNKGDFAARDVRVRASWARGRGGASGPREHTIDEQPIGDVPGRDALALTVRDLQRGLPAGGGWDRIVVRVRARNALPRKATLALAARPARADEAAAGAAEATPPVRYQKERPCVTPDGQHHYVAHRLANDGVTEEWQVCRRCGLAHRAPLSREDEATQRRVRAERAAREQREMEEELARRQREDARSSRGEARYHAPPPPRGGGDGDSLPRQVALWILQLDEAEPDDHAIDAAYRKLAKQYHPDKAATMDEAARRVLEERMRDLNRARDVLKQRP